MPLLSLDKIVSFKLNEVETKFVYPTPGPFFWAEIYSYIVQTPMVRKLQHGIKIMHIQNEVSSPSLKPQSHFGSSELVEASDERLLLASLSPSCNETKMSSPQPFLNEERFSETTLSLRLFWCSGDPLGKLGMNWCSMLGAASDPSSNLNFVSMKNEFLVGLQGSTSNGMCWIWSPNGSNFSSTFSFGRIPSGVEESPTVDPIAVTEKALCSCTATAYDISKESNVYYFTDKVTTGKTGYNKNMRTSK